MDRSFFHLSRSSCHDMFHFSSSLRQPFATTSKIILYPKAPARPRMSESEDLSDWSLQNCSFHRVSGLLNELELEFTSLFLASFCLLAWLGQTPLSPNHIIDTQAESQAKPNTSTNHQSISILIAKSIQTRASLLALWAVTLHSKLFTAGQLTYP
jgi:hypothetical protein